MPLEQGTATRSGKLEINSNYRYTTTTTTTTTTTATHCMAGKYYSNTSKLNIVVTGLQEQHIECLIEKHATVAFD